MTIFAIAPVRFGIDNDWQVTMGTQGQTLRTKTQREVVESLCRLPFPAFVFEVSSGRFLCTNALFQELVGYSGDELNSMLVEEIQPESHISNCHSARKEQPPQGLLKWQYCCKNGSLLDVKVHYRNLAYVSDSGKDVTARFVVVEFWQPAAAA
jgi:PAS domain S-box-containing protein